MWTKKHSKKFTKAEHSKEFLRKPHTLKELGNLKGKRLVDIGCGSGYWTRLFAQRGADCTGVDISENQLALARKEEGRKSLGIKYLKGDFTNLKKIKSNRYDIAVIIYALLEIPSKTKINKLFQEAYRILKKGGRLFISDMHPFDPITHARFKLPKGFHYFMSGAKMIAYAKQVDGSLISFKDYHWTFEDYFDSLTKAGFVITSLKEPRPSPSLVKKIPYFKYRIGLPKDITIVCRK
ncbi:class I SAM-dependent methyltransferase [Candidatus Pacearchaeota archaeon]|nr:class I SAM-dependent methyltransferase [Candidatus Pacearchaeota archaeon]